MEIPRSEKLPADKPCPATTRLTPSEKDGNGFNDAVEQRLAEQYAPIVYYVRDEPNLPTNVDWFLPKTSLYYFDHRSHQKRLCIKSPGQQDLHWIQRDGWGAKEDVDSYEWCDRNKAVTFYLEDVPDRFRRGSLDSTEWVTYFHTYLNDIGGITVQYWRFYAYNTGLVTHIAGIGEVEIGCHGGDWEGVHVVLDASHEPVALRLLGHAGIEQREWPSIKRIGGRPVVYAERGSHTSLLEGSEDGVRHESWTAGSVKWPDGNVTSSGPLVNVGSRQGAMNGQFFIYYAGLWGSPSRVDLPVLNYINSGCWGPAFNEIGERSDGFVEAWCAGIAEKDSGECFSRSRYSQRLCTDLIRRQLSGR